MCEDAAPASVGDAGGAIGGAGCQTPLAIVRIKSRAVVLLQPAVAQQHGDAQRRGGPLRARSARHRRGREDRLVAALQMAHDVRPLAPQLCKRQNPAARPAS